MTSYTHTPASWLLALAAIAMLSLTACGVCGEDEQPDAQAQEDTGDKKADAKKDSKGSKKDAKAPKKADKGSKKATLGKNPNVKGVDTKKLNDKKSIAAKKRELIDKAKAKVKENKKAKALDTIQPKAPTKPGKKGPTLDFASPSASNLEDLPKNPPPKAANAGGDTLDITGAVTRSDVKSTTGYRGILRPNELPGINPDASYNAIRLMPTDKEQFGVAVQVWREPNPGAQSRRFNDLLRQYPGGKRTRDLGDSSFNASWGQLNYVVWLDRKRRVIVALSCDQAICKDSAAALKLARKVSKKIRKY